MPISKYIQTAGAKVLTQVPKRVGPTGAYVLFQRPSLLTEAERLGIPKGERNQPNNNSENFRKKIIEQYNSWIRDFNGMREQTYNFLSQYNTKPSVLDAYPIIPIETSLSKALSTIKTTLNRHNQFYRGVTLPTSIEDLNLVRGMSSEAQLKTAATTPRPQDILFFSPQSNAFIYGGTSVGKTALIQRPFKLGKNPLNWIKEGDFKILGASTNFPEGQIMDPWTRAGKAQTLPTELISKTPFRFIKWAEEPSLNETSLNWRTYKKGGILKK